MLRKHAKGSTEEPHWHEELASDAEAFVSRPNLEKKGRKCRSGGEQLPPTGRFDNPYPTPSKPSASYPNYTTIQVKSQRNEINVTAESVSELQELTKRKLHTELASKRQ